MKTTAIKIFFASIVLVSIVLLGGCTNSLPVNAKTYQMTDSWGGKGAHPGEFNEPTGIAITSNEIFVSDARNARIQVFDLTGKFKRAFGNTGDKKQQLGRPMNLAVHGNELYIADYFNDQIKIYSLDGTFKRSIGSSGNGPGQFNAPVGVDVATNGDIYVADFYNQRIQQLSSDSGFIRQWGETEKTGIWSGKFNYPTDVALTANNTLYVADGFNDRVQVFNNQGEYSHKWGGLFGMNVSGNKPGWFKTVTAIKIGPDKNIYVADFYNDRVQIFTPAGELVNIIDVPSSGVQHSSIAVAVSTDGSLYIVNHGKHQVEHWQAQ